MMKEQEKSGSAAVIVSLTLLVVLVAAMFEGKADDIDYWVDPPSGDFGFFNSTFVPANITFNETLHVVECETEMGVSDGGYWGRSYCYRCKNTNLSIIESKPAGDWIC